MKILAVHNRYQRPGGEDQVFLDETALLEGRNHRVLRCEVHNDQVEHMNQSGKTPTFWDNLLLAGQRRTMGNPVQGCAQDVAQALSMQPAGSSSLGPFSCPLFTRVRGKKKNSAKFTVAISPA
jgi:hypothetical protein